MSFDFSTLITDRSQADVEALRALLSTTLTDWTAEQLAAFNQAASKGAYNYTDLNRVTACMDYLNERLTALGYVTGYQPIIVHPEAGPVVDANTLLLIHGGAVEDASIYDVPITNSGVTVSQAQSKFGGGSLYFNGSAYLSVAQMQNFPSGTDDFTIDFWWKDDSSPEGGAIFSHAFPGNPGFGILFYYRTQGQWLGYTTTSNTQWNGLIGKTLGSVSTNWTHFAIVRYSGTYLAFENGQLVGNYADATQVSGLAAALLIGKYDYSHGACIKGYLDEFRISNVARWTENFTPPNTPYDPTIPSPEPGLDPYTWYESDIPTVSTMEAYLANVLGIWNTIMGEPALPTTMDALDLQGANQIETALVEVNRAIVQVLTAMSRSNAFTFWSGNRPFPAAYSNYGRTWAELDAMNTTWANWQAATWYLLLYGNLLAEGDVM